ncbi:MAG TPA: helix-turn-helix domain-containing protein [Hymenobacter sp.]|uniref:Excisionase family DNA-binding protein n=2 Tax=Hymenobacter TaxID=89966 RepID=A0A7K1TKX5_9BACT|nr:MULTISPECIES: helix-turn-helix domain-containing protein [Hymenobacter]MVN79069.1 excisionase family DNA-binding protein [Hymenobacter ginkgonis]TVT36993.1 helix-turn-helix domain-containing protein [Hymenobacter setariae]HET9505621.1 helix-turn-helix domain-containing protein [Hymenobacter sp.]
MKAILETLSLQDQRVARDSLFSFTRAIAAEGTDRVKIRLPGRDEDITIPRKALELLSFILSSMAEGKAIALVPSAAELSTQQAADMLHVSQPHLVKMLEQGVLPFKKVGSHRRVLLQDLLQYEAQQAEQRRQQLRFLAQQAQELSLGYE